MTESQFKIGDTVTPKYLGNKVIAMSVHNISNVIVDCAYYNDVTGKFEFVSLHRDELRLYEHKK